LVRFELLFRAAELRLSGISIPVEARELPSRYGAFITAYHAPIPAFVRRIVEQLPPDDDTHTDWIEIQSWAEHISAWLPGFPSWSDFLARTPDERSAALESLTDTLTMIILNASVIHAGDHTLLHKMMDEKPVPFHPARSATAHRVSQDRAAKVHRHGDPILTGVLE
jgi:hypothetical protein